MNSAIQRIGRFEIWGTWSPEFLLSVETLLTHYEPFLPDWCHIAHVEYESTMNGAECGVDFEYRRVRMTLGGAFFKNTEQERHEQFVHELMHANAHHLYNVAYDLLGDSLKDNEMALTLARKSLREANEGVMCDLARLFLRLRPLASDGVS